MTLCLCVAKRGGLQVQIMVWKQKVRFLSLKFGNRPFILYLCFAIGNSECDCWLRLTLKRKPFYSGKIFVYF